MRPENNPWMQYRLVIVQRSGDRGKSVRLRTVDQDNFDRTVWQQDWPSGNPTHADLEDLLANMVTIIESDLICRFGVQGLLTR